MKILKLCKLSWRNIWRNRRRSLISIASVFFAVFFCVIMMGFQQGAWSRMIDNMLRTQTGHIQIHAKGYWDEKIIDNFMYMDASVISQLERIEQVENVSPRVEIFAMSSFGTISKGIAVIGVSPEKEAQKSNLSSRIVRGEYLSENDKGILIGEGLSKYLKANVGDTIALIGQGYHGANAAALFPIRGILKMLTGEMDNGLTYMTLASAQEFIDMPNGYSGILISIKDNNRLDETINEVKRHCGLASHFVQSTSDPQSPVNNEIAGQARNDGDQARNDGDQARNDGDQDRNDDYAVYSWHFTMERLLQTSQSDKVFGVLIMSILYVIVGFGILGTIIMMTNERRREFCVMISLGMQRLRLAAVVGVELLMMSLIGVVLAFAVTLPVVHWYAAHPIQFTDEAMIEMFVSYGMEPVLPMSVEPSIFTGQIITVLAIVLLAVIYPVNHILKLKITNNND